MFSKILFATDLSPASERVLDYLATLRPLGTRNIVLLHVIYVKHTVGLSEVMQEEAAPVLEQQKDRLQQMGFEVETQTQVGVPGPEITRVALEQDCKLIAVGSHGKSMAQEVALGGVATDVVHRSELPVLVVRMAIVEEEGQTYCKVIGEDIMSHVLYPTDFSDNAERAFQYVEALASSGCKKITLMHVQDISAIFPHLEQRLEEFYQIDRARLERLEARLRELGVSDIQTEIPLGHPANEIVRLIRETCPSVVVMGSHGRGFVADLFLGSVSHNVVRHSAAPVLLVPPVH